MPHPLAPGLLDFPPQRPLLITLCPSQSLGTGREDACLTCNVEMTPVATWRTAPMVSDTSNTASLSS